MADRCRELHLDDAILRAEAVGNPAGALGIVPPVAIDAVPVLIAARIQGDLGLPHAFGIPLQHRPAVVPAIEAGGQDHLLCLWGDQLEGDPLLGRSRYSHILISSPVIATNGRPLASLIQFTSRVLWQ